MTEQIKVKYPHPPSPSLLTLRPAMMVLREKGYTYRAIKEWLKDHQILKYDMRDVSVTCKLPPRKLNLTLAEQIISGRLADEATGARDYRQNSQYGQSAKYDTMNIQAGGLRPRALRPTILILRAKGFMYKDVREWCAEQGLRSYTVRALERAVHDKTPMAKLSAEQQVWVTRIEVAATEEVAK